MQAALGERNGPKGTLLAKIVETWATKGGRKRGETANYWERSFVRFSGGSMA